MRGERGRGEREGGIHNDRPRLAVTQAISTSSAGNSYLDDGFLGLPGLG